MRKAYRARGVRLAIFLIAVSWAVAGAYATSIRISFTDPSESGRLSSANVASSSSAVFRMTNYESTASALIAGSSHGNSASNRLMSRGSNGREGIAATEVVSVNRRHHHQVTGVAAAVVTQASGVPDSGNTLLMLFGSVAALIALHRFRATNCPPV